MEKKRPPGAPGVSLNGSSNLHSYCQRNHRPTQKTSRNSQLRLLRHWTTNTATVINWAPLVLHCCYVAGWVISYRQSTVLATPEKTARPPLSAHKRPFPGPTQTSDDRQDSAVINTLVHGWKVQCNDQHSSACDERYGMVINTTV